MTTLEARSTLHDQGTLTEQADPADRRGRAERAAPPQGGVEGGAEARRDVAFIAWGAVAGRSQEIARSLGGEARCFFPKGGARRPPVPVRYALSAAATAWYLWRRRPRVVVVTNPPVPAAWFTSLWARALGAAVLVDSHPGGFGAQSDRVSARLQWLHRRVVRRAAGVLVTDEEWCRRVRDWGGTPVVVHEAPGDEQAPPPAAGGRFRVLVVGNFNRDEPMAAVWDAACQLPECEFIVTGEPDKCPPGLRASSPRNVRLVGFLDPDRYRDALQACSVVMTLTDEPTSVMRAAYEAVYARRPVVVSDWPVSRRLFPHAVHAGNDPFDLVAAIEKVQANYHHMAALVDVARAEQLGRWEHQLRALGDLVDRAERAGTARPRTVSNGDAGRVKDSRRGGDGPALSLVLDDLELQGAVRHIVTSAARGRGGRVANVNLDSVRQARRNPDLRQAINECDLVLADGVPVVWATRLQGAPVAERVSASEMIWPVCEEAAGQGVGVFLLGGAPGAGSRAAIRLAAQAPGLRIDHLCPPWGFEHSESEMQAIVRALDRVRPGIVFCAFGIPKQERVMQLLAPRFPSMWFVACGGTFEMVCGDLPQAPVWMRRHGLEWIHRLRLEPRRLFGRYLVHDLPFAPTLFALALVARLAQHSRTVLDVRRPLTPFVEEGGAGPVTAGTARAAGAADQPDTAGRPERIRAGGRAGRAVLIVPDYLPSLGGTTTQCRAHALELARRGWDVTILTRRVRWGGGREQIDGIGVRRVGLPLRTRRAKPFWLLGTWWWLATRRRTISAVSVLMVADLALCAWAAGLGSSTVLTWVTQGDPTRQLGPRRGRIRRAVLQRCRHVVLTPAMASELSGLSVRVADVIAVPVDTSWFRPPAPEERDAARRAVGVTGDVVTFVGHVQARKAVDRLLAALAILRGEGREVSAVVVGGPVEAEDAAYMASLERDVESRSLSASVRFAGPQRDVRPFLFAADVMCLPSEREGMPNVLLEAMACGVPCVAPSSAGGDALLGDLAECVPASNDPVDLARAIAALLDDPGARDRAVQHNLDRVHRLHGIGSIVDRYEALAGDPH